MLLLFYSKYSGFSFMILLLLFLHTAVSICTFMSLLHILLVYKATNKVLERQVRLFDAMVHGGSLPVVPCLSAVGWRAGGLQSVRLQGQPCRRGSASQGTGLQPGLQRPQSRTLHHCSSEGTRCIHTEMHRCTLSCPG